MEAGTSQERDAGLKGVEAIVEREQRPLTEGNDDGLLLRSENTRVGLARPHRSVCNAGTLAPFSYCLSVEVVASSQAGYALLTTLYRSTRVPQSCGRCRVEVVPQGLLG